MASTVHCVDDEIIGWLERRAFAMSASVSAARILAHATLTLALAVFEVSAVTAVTAVRWFAADAAAQPPLIGMGWHARAFHDPANRHAVPDHHRRINARVVLVWWVHLQGEKSHGPAEGGGNGGAV